MKDFSNIEEKIKKLEDANLLANSMLSIHKEQIDSLLLLTESVNKNFSAAAIISLLENNLKDLLKVNNYTLLLKSNEWSVMLNHGHPFNLNEIKIEEELINIGKSRNTKKFKNPQLKQFEFAIPVLHKNDYLAFLLLDDLQIRYIDFTEDEKLRYIETLLNLTVISLENKKLVRKLNEEEVDEDLILAAEVQAELIPSIFPKSNHYEFFGKYIPFNTIGGDYYDLIQIDDENIAFCICDVAGKGISAGMLMSNFQASLRTLISRQYNIKDLVVALNEKFINVTKQNRFISMFIAMYNTQTKKMEYVNAGHNAPILKNGNDFHLLKKGCTILGMLDDLYGIESGEIVIKDEAMLVMYTDGLSEIQNDDDVEFGVENIEEYIKTNNTKPLAIFTEGLINEAEIFKGDNDIFDDVSLLCAKFKA